MGRATRKASTGLLAAEGIIKENVGLLLTVSGGMVTKDVERAEVLNVFASVFYIRLAFGNPTSPRSVGKSGARKTYPQWRGIGLKNFCMKNLYTHWVYISPMESLVLRKLVNVIERSLLIIFERLWLLGEVSEV